MPPRPLGDGIKLVPPLTGQLYYGSWFDHAVDALQYPQHPRMLFLSYEAMQKDLRAVLQTVMEFTGCGSPPWNARRGGGRGGGCLAVPCSGRGHRLRNSTPQSHARRRYHVAPHVLEQTIMPRLGFKFMKEHDAVFDFTLKYPTRRKVCWMFRNLLFQNTSPLSVP